MIKLNLGCGQIRPEGWINADSSMNALLQRLPLGKWIATKLGGVTFESSNVVYMNLNRRWKNILDHSVDVVYASHLFEHLEIEKTTVFLSETFRVLKPNGCIRLVMPDLYKHCKLYIEKFEEGDVNASKNLLWAMNLYDRGPGERHNITHKILGFLQGYPHRHKYMYDQLTLSKLLTDNGFVNIQISDYGQSHYVSSILDVEGPHLYGGYPHSIYIEAQKPKQ